MQKLKRLFRLPLLFITAIPRPKLKRPRLPHIRRLSWRRLLVLVVVILLLLVVIGCLPLLYATLRFQNRIYAAADVPHRRVAIVFGARVMPDGQLSAMLKDRVAAAADLYHTGKTDILLLTGDNRFVDYNEPGAMRRYALDLGVPDDAIVLDYAGRRTYDSCYRARDIFQVDEAILVTQRFHLPRALLLCNGLGVDSVGVAADYQRPEGYLLRSLLYSQSREFVAAGFALLDLIRRPTPVLGEPLPIARAG